MSTTRQTTYANARLQDVIAGDSGWTLRLRRGFFFVLKALIGAWFCQGMFGAFGALNFIGSIIVTGWTYRLMQRHALKVWWKHSQPWNEGMRFETFAASRDAFRHHLNWPNFFLRPNFFRHLRSVKFQNLRLPGKIRFVVSSVFRSLGRNFVTGARAVFNTWIVTAIPVILLQVAWYQGWDNSFNKGYEQAAIGPATFWTGILLFAAAMFYLPLAQARQAVTGEWKAFFHFKSVRQIIRRRWFYCFLLAALYALLTFPVYSAKGAIYGLGNKEAIAALPPLAQWEWLNSYLFNVSLFILLPSFVLVRIFAAAIYASAVKEIVKAGDSHCLHVTAFEQEAFRALDINERPRDKRSLPARFILWTGTLSGRLFTGFLSFWLWVAVAVQPAMQQFFIYHSGLKGYLNHPLVQMPWFHFVPAQLSEAAGKR